MAAGLDMFSVILFMYSLLALLYSNGEFMHDSCDKAIIINELKKIISEAK